MINGFHVWTCNTLSHIRDSLRYLDPPCLWINSIYHRMFWTNLISIFIHFVTLLFSCMHCDLKFAHFHEMHLSNLKLFHEVLKLEMHGWSLFPELTNWLQWKSFFQNMAEKFCNQFGSGPHHLKIGKSFEKKNGNSVFHSIRWVNIIYLQDRIYSSHYRYDFTPLSVDEESMGKLEVQENSGVSVSLPHNDGVNATNYKGQAKPASTKDCILIIDHETGELTLERLSNQVDKTIDSPKLMYCIHY